MNLDNETLIFSEIWYRSRYPDVERVIAEGHFKSGLEHFLKFGKAERRQGFPPSDQYIKREARVFAFGAFGTNNVGDEAILEGLRVEFPDVIPIYLNKPRLAEGFWINDVIGYQEFFGKGDKLIIGGGGIFYHIDAVNHMLQLAKNVILRGGQVVILRVGCEAATEELFPGMVELFNLAADISVRTKASANILKSLIMRDVRVEPDFAFNLNKFIRPAGGGNTDLMTIGIVTDGDARNDLTDISGLIERHIPIRLIKKGNVQFIHIPHSRAYVGRFNNDVVVGHMLWSSINIFSERREEHFQRLEFDSNPFNVLASYRGLDGVISARFHGMIFARMVGIPLLASRGWTLKNKSFIDDNPADDVFCCNSPDELEGTFNKFIECVAACKNKKSGVASTGK